MRYPFLSGGLPISRIWAWMFASGLLLISGCMWTADAPAATPAQELPVLHQDATSAEVQEIGYRLTPAPQETAAPAAAERAPLTLLAAGSGKARIVDRDRNTVRTAPGDGTIFRIQMSPDHRHVLLFFGDARYTVASAETLDDVKRLPSHPPVEDDATGFVWFFLDDAHLLGASQLRSTDTAGRMASEIDSLPPRATLLYVYSLENDALAPVQIDHALPSTFSLSEAANGRVTLLTADDRLLDAKVVLAQEN